MDSFSYPLKIALKVEPGVIHHKQLSNEYTILNAMQGEPGFPRVLFYDETESGNIMGMELLAASIDKVFGACNNRFGLKTTILLVDAMLSRLEALHRHRIVFRDVKPANFMLQRIPNEMGQRLRDVMIIDFGLSKKLDSNNVVLRPHRKLVGTARYASINALRGMPQGPMDDLEALSYVMLYFLWGRLPWQSLKCSRLSSKYGMILRRKEALRVDQYPSTIPAQLAAFINITRTATVPDYALLRRLLRQTFVEAGFIYE